MINILYAVLIITAVGLLAGVILSVASKLMAVPTDERTEQIRACLPGANCGACGYTGCDGYAAAISSGEAEPDKCTPGGAATAAELSLVLGVEITPIRVVASVKCNHGLDKANADFAYTGAASCRSAKLLYGGQLQCKYGCLGFGDCVNVCEKNAISVIDGVAVVNKELCYGCGKCAAICPNTVISLVPFENRVKVACNNNEKGAAARKKCTAACIGCMKCVKVCESDAIKVENFLASIDADKCTSCGKCISACPQKCIILDC